MSSWMIDDFGNDHRAGSSELTRSLGYTGGGPAVEQYAIENIGHIGLSEHAGRVHVRCRPDILHERAISGLNYWLRDHGATRVVLSWLDDIWHMERAMPLEGAMSFVNHLVEKRKFQPSHAGPLFLSQPSASGACRWAKAASELNATFLHGSITDASREILERAYHGRWMLMDVDTLQGRADMIDRGDGFPGLHPDLAGSRRSMPYEEFPDVGYRAWVYDTYREMHQTQTQQPRFDDVDAFVQWPRIGSMRTRYWRMLVPLPAKTGGLRRLLTISGGDSSIDLRPKRIEVGG